MTENKDPKPSRQMAHDAASSANLRTALSARADSVSSSNVTAALQKGTSSANLNTALASRPAAQAQTAQPSPAPASQQPKT
jgi:hypothetical protein